MDAIPDRPTQDAQRQSADADGERQPAQSSSHGSPAMRLYRHALESIFALLELEDLSRVLAVCREWSAAVRSMQPIGARIQRDAYELDLERKTLQPLPPIDALVASPLLRHVSAIEVKSKAEDFAPLTSQSLPLLAHHAPHITSLWCNLTLTPNAPLLFPATLTTLHLRLSGRSSAGEYDRVLMALAALPTLQRLLFRIHSFMEVDVSLLGASPSLRELTLEESHRHYPWFSDDQIAQIRSSLGHLQRVAFGERALSAAVLARFLEPPVTMRWQDIGTLPADAHTGVLLVTLPTLTTLNLWFTEDAPRVNFLSQLPLLTTLKLECQGFDADGVHIPAAPLLASLLPCIGITELDLSCDFDAVQISTLLATLKKLRTLQLGIRLESLQCFAAGPATLEELCVYQPGPALPPAELVHLYALQGLRSLELDHVLELLDEVTLASLTPPTARLPRLARFVHTNSGDWRSRVEHTGPSFEWMQQRLTQ